MRTNVFSAIGFGGIIGIIIAVVVIAVIVLLMIMSRYKKCPSDKVMVVYGAVGRTKDGSARSSKCIHGGASFVWPVFQAYGFLDLTPISINIDLRNALSRQNIRIDVPSRFTVGISTEAGIMQNAAERLLGLKLVDIQDLAKDIILGQLRLVVAQMDIEEINSDRDKFVREVANSVETELKKIGLKLINVNVTDITDESGYIEALGQEAAEKAKSDAKRAVSEKRRDGDIGEANALMEQRIKVAQATAAAVEGENLSQAKMAQSNAERREKEAESERRATVAEMIAEAKAKEEAYKAEQLAEQVRAEREKSTLEADVIVKVEVEKRKKELEAEAEAETIRRKAKGEADALMAMKMAEAKGMYEILSKQAEGFERIVKAAGGADAAVQMLLTDKMEELVRLQVDAIKNVKIDKVTVWDSMSGKDGASTTSNFISSMLKSVPPMNEMFKMNGMELPEYLGKTKEETPRLSAAEGSDAKSASKRTGK